MAVILVIDDESAIRSLVVRSLTRVGHTVLEAPNGRLGMDLLRARSVDLVVTDILMPEMEGIETIRELRRGFPAVGIVAMSGGGAGRENTMFLDAASKLGADAILQKPFRAAELTATIDRVLGSHR